MSFRKSKFVTGRFFVLLLVIGAGAALLPFTSALTNTAAQTKPASGKSQARKPKPEAKATPTPTALERLGEPPPPPKLRVRPEQDIAPGEVISVDTTEILLPVTVRDSEG